MFYTEGNYAYTEDGLTLAINRTQSGYGLVMIKENGKAETILPFIYDNMYFIWADIGDFMQDYLCVVHNGKYGAFLLSYDDFEDWVGCKEVIPCQFDEIHIADENKHWFFMTKQGESYYYNCKTNEISSAYDSIKTLHPKVLGLWKDYEQTIIDLSGNKNLYSPEYGWEYKYVCKYRDGAVFKVMETSVLYTDSLWRAKLVFYSEKLNKTFVTPVYEKIMVNAVEDGNGTFYIRSFDVFNDGGWTTYEMERRTWTDEDIEVFFPVEEENVVC